MDVYGRRRLVKLQQAQVGDTPAFLIRKRSVVQVLGGPLPGDAAIEAMGLESAHVGPGCPGAGQAGPGWSAEPP
jgi:hypothetical protein